jgi:hypothetical protein
MATPATEHADAEAIESLLDVHVKRGAIPAHALSDWRDLVLLKFEAASSLLDSFPDGLVLEGPPLRAEQPPELRVNERDHFRPRLDLGDLTHPEER